ncbi:MAG: autotransporter-associated beta strand repeat-containing protein [Thermoguttaceae bacterium]
MKMFGSPLLSRLALAAGVMFALATASFGSTILDTQGFEAPAYTLGALQGQNGWEWTGGNSTATVENSVVLSGSQAVAVNRAANSDSRWGVPVSGYPQSPNNVIQIGWDMNVAQTTGFHYGPFFGVEAYDGAISGNPGLFGSLGVDASTRDVLYQAQDTGYFTETGTTLDPGWNHFSMVLNFATDQYSAYVNGNLLATTGFVDRGRGLTSFTDADLSALAATGDPSSLAATGTAYYDNFVSTGPIAADWSGGRLPSTSWATTGNWTVVGVPGSTTPAPYDTVDLPAGLASAAITLDGATPKLNALSINSGSGPASAYSIARGTGGYITFGGVAPVISIQGGTNNVISAPVVLESNISVNTDANTLLTMSGGISGPGQSLTKAGLGTLVLSGSDSYSGGTTIAGGTLAYTDPSAVDSGSIEFAGGNLVLNFGVGGGQDVLAAGAAGLNQPGGAEPAIAIPATAPAATLAGAPEPGTLGLLGAGLLAALVAWLWRRACCIAIRK